MDNPSRLALVVDKLKNLPRAAKIMLITGLVLVVVIFTLAVLRRKPADVPLQEDYKVGEINITKQDIKERYELLYPDDSEEVAKTENWQTAIDQLSRSAILQNEGVKVGLFTNTPDGRIDPKKVNEAEKYFNTKGTTYISGEMFTIWFYNTDPPAIGVEFAKQKALEIITGLQQRVASGELSMKQAGDIIASRTDLVAIDFAYNWNAYAEFLYIHPGEKVINDPELDKKLWELEEGGISEVLIGKDFNGTEWYPAYFKVIRINEKRQTDYDNLEQLIEARQREGQKLEL